jgi:uncharacterized protein
MPDQPLAVGRLGFGCYRVDDETPEHRQALDLAIDSGCRLIDTSTNYTDGASERLVGAALEDLARRDRKKRDAVRVVSKIGYVQGANLDLAIERERSGRPFPDMVRYMDGCWHCIHPEFLRDQLARSRERLKLETLDACLLHNPEYFLSDARKKHTADAETARAAFYERVRLAFGFFEEAVSRGDIRFYGVSSNTAVSPASDPEGTSVSRFLDAAKQAGGDGHHFRVLQIPMNLFESGGAITRNTGTKGGQTALEAAAAAGLTVLINRPLNSFVGQRLVRLAEPIGMAGEASLPELVARLLSLEREYRSGLGAPSVLGAPSGSADHAAASAADPLFELVEQISGLPDEVEDFVQWRQIEQQYVIPRINHVVGSVARGLPEEARGSWGAWWDRYLPALQALLAEIGRTVAQRGRSRTDSIAKVIDPLLPEERRGEPLSRKATWVLASTPGVSAVLVGMRRPEYVRDLMRVIDWPPHPDPLEVYRHLKDAIDVPA